MQSGMQYRSRSHHAVIRVYDRAHNQPFPSRCASITKMSRPKFHVFVKCRPSNALDNIMKTNPIAEDSGWNFSFWFAVSSPLLGVLLAMLALAIFCR
jgi:hypothetical protein